jgi:hypothetical protein
MSPKETLASGIRVIFQPAFWKSSLKKRLFPSPVCLPASACIVDRMNCYLLLTQADRADFQNMETGRLRLTNRTKMKQSGYLCLLPTELLLTVILLQITYRV